MTPRERVQKCLNFDKPDRAPKDLWLSPYIALFEKYRYEELIKDFPMDIKFPPLSTQWDNNMLQAVKNTGTYKDSWGTVWKVPQAGTTGHVTAPALPNWSQLDKFQPPRENLKKTDLSSVNKLCEKSDQFIISNVTASPFERLQALRGTENLFIDLAYGTAQLRKLLKMLHQFYLEDIRSWCRSNVDAVFFMDDWGSEKSLLVSPEIFEELFKPLYKQYCEIIHQHGKYAFFHSDGNIEQIFPDLVETGIDAINSQLFTMNIEKLAENHKGKVTFWGEIDRQNILPSDSPEKVQQAVMRIRSALDDGKGGIIAQCQWEKNTPPENIKTIFQDWLKKI